jgi:hypothetical protein
MGERDFKGVWIPKFIWLDEKLSLMDKYYLSVYHQCDCLASEADEMMLQIASKSTILASKKKLVELGRISLVADPEQA